MRIKADDAPLSAFGEARSLSDLTDGFEEEPRTCRRGFTSRPEAACMQIETRLITDDLMVGSEPLILESLSSDGSKPLTLVEQGPGES